MIETTSQQTSTVELIATLARLLQEARAGVPHRHIVATVDATLVSSAIVQPPDIPGPMPRGNI
ncbi:hypothetical protein [Corynebacterium striatum]|uniref:hypothetical protein n=1 Tax=Corynebacterium striatum TaxID=43770 RepID=UPI0011776862|nr:hypothetical protein [Corynebacterium striatum]